MFDADVTLMGLRLIVRLSSKYCCGFKIKEEVREEVR